jgi:hypothetical protein
MAGGRKRKGTWVPRVLRHRSLMTSEAILIVGALQEVIQQQVGQLALPNWGKVLWVMASTLGLLGVVLFFVRAFAEKGVAKTHDVVQAIPLPTPTLLVHVAIYAGLFLLYAKVWNLPVW